MAINIHTIMSKMLQSIISTNAENNEPIMENSDRSIDMLEWSK